MSRRRGERKTDVHLSFPNKLLDLIEEQVEKSEFTDRTHAILYFIRIGMRIEEFKVKCEDPEFANDVRALWGVEEAAEWLNNMPETQMNTISKAWELAKRKREMELSKMSQYP